jgi:hypothetical protein
MEIHETLSRVRRLYGFSGQRIGRTAQRHQAACGRTSQASGAQSEPSRAKAKDKAEGRQTFRFGPRLRSGEPLIKSRLSYLAGDLGPSQTLADDLTNCQVKTVTVLHIIAVIEAIRLLVKVTEQMKRLHAHVGSADSTLQKRPEILQAVRMDMPINIGYGVINHLMRILASQPVVRLERVAVERRASFYMLAYLSLKRTLLSIWNYRGAHLAAALKDAHDGGFIFSASAGNATRTLRNVHVPRLAADESFVHFDMARKFFGQSAVDRKPNAMHQVPCRFLTDAQRPGDFIAADSVLAIQDQPSRNHPFIDSERRIFHDGSGLQGELPFVVMRGALPAPNTLQIANLCASACRAGNAVRPATHYEVGNAVIGIVEVYDGFLKCLWFACHGSILRRNRGFVK